MQKVESVLICSAVVKPCSFSPPATVSATCLAAFLAVARYVPLGNVSCDLCHNDVDVARKIAQCNSAWEALETLDFLAVTG